MSERTGGPLMTMREAVKIARQQAIRAALMAHPDADRATIAKALGISITGFINQALEFGIPLPAGKHAGGRRLSAAGSKARNAEARILYESGLTMQAVANRLGITNQYVSALAKRDEWQKIHHRCDALCAALRAWPGSVVVGEASRKLLVPQSSIWWRLGHHPEIPRAKGSRRHRCTQQCDRLRKALTTATSYREAAQQAGWPRTVSTSITQRYKVYHPDFTWERAKGLPGGKQKP